MDKKVLKDYGVMPNVKSKDESVVDFLGKMTWFHAMTLALQKHSEFMRPELADSYPDMEYAYPDPQGLQWDQPIDTITSESFGGLFCPYCTISAMGFRKFGSNDDCDGQICFPWSGVICMTPEDTALHGATSRELESAYGTDVESHISLTTFGNAYRAAAWSWEIIAATGNTEVPKLIRVTPASRKLSTSFICIEPEGGEWPVGKFTVKVTMVDMYGNICSDKLDYECEFDCCGDEGYIAVAIDEGATPSTIAPGGDITVTITDGCAPYSWSVAGSGFSFAQATTEGKTNTLSLASGVCGSEGGPAAYGTVTVTDDCGNVSTMAILNTGGSWSADSYACGVPQSTSQTCTGDAIGIYRYVATFKAQGCYPVSEFCNSELPACCGWLVANYASMGFRTAVGNCYPVCSALGAPCTNACETSTGMLGWVTYVRKDIWEC